ncbi:MAG: outer membrane protein OmpK [Desulfuromusa sp.]
MSRQLLRSVILTLVLVLGFGFAASAAQWSSTKIELLYGWDYERFDKDKEEGMILTIANATGWKYGDIFMFADVGSVDERDKTDGIHMEIAPRLSLLRTLGQKPMDGLLKDVYVIVQSDIDANAFVNKVTLMGGLSADWNIPGFMFFKTTLQYRNDPDLDGDSVQGTLVWNAPFTIGGQNFSFEGFLDYTSAEGTSHTNLLTQPQLMWLATDNIAVGVEYQYWQNRIGIKDLDESLPQLIVRWTF